MDSSNRELLSAVAEAGALLPAEAVTQIVEKACPRDRFRGQRVVLIIPDNTRTAPIGLVFKALHRHLGSVVSALDILVALGTHPPMSDEAICQRLEITPEERLVEYGQVRFFNHEWDNPAALKPLGHIPADEISKLSDGLFAMDVPVSINKRVFDYDEIMIIGPVFPHEVVGFSGGNKYLFPGVSGPEILNFFHWLGAVITTMGVIGHKWTPVRRVVDRAGAMIGIPKLCFALVVKGNGLRGLFAGTPETAWDHAADLSAQTHIVWKTHDFHTIVSCAPPMYDELWVGAKCMYKLEPVLAPGGELIIYAPHLHEISVTHGKLIRQVGYHCRDYFLKQWDQFKDFPWGTLAHSTHVFGLGTFENGVEQARAKVTLATGIPEEVCREINLGWRDWRSLRLEDYANREDEGILLVPKSGETLYRLSQ
ncbi:MAG TPA: lactate racemase domain-containing protein [Candidatus Limnocylindria bacterium]|jgi:nickel-dependent lactate racemase|nr:lactate racemase domain-containing protein [Candidatus Limnocylindria bacterium]